jgi:hypothetical protein
MLEFVFWDVQHGHACYIKTPNNRHMVVDLGIGSYSENRSFSPLLHLKNKYGAARISFIMAFRYSLDVPLARGLLAENVLSWWTERSGAT